MTTNSHNHSHNHKSSSFEMDDAEMITLSSPSLHKTPPVNANNRSSTTTTCADLSTGVGMGMDVGMDMGMDIGLCGSTSPCDVGVASVRVMNPPSRRPTLQHQHSFAVHEQGQAHRSSVTTSNHHPVARAPSGRPYLATRHLSIEELDSNSNNHNNNSMNDRDRAMMLDESSFLSHDNLFSPNNDNNSNDNSNNQSHSFLLMGNDNDNATIMLTPPPSSPTALYSGDDAQRQAPSPITAPMPQPAPQNNIADDAEETPEERARREEEESIALAQMLMAEEAMASHRMSADFLRMNSDQFSPEDFQALQHALREEEEADDDNDDADDDDVVQGDEEGGDLSYEALLQLGERMGDVKTDRWTMIAHKEIAKLETFQYQPIISSTTTANATTTINDDNIDDSELKCLVCQFAYETGDHLRRLPCKHCFHRDCIDEWLKTKDICAYCRQSICRTDNGN